MAYGNPIPLTDFEPDTDPRTPGVLTDCDGFFGSQKGLKTLPSFVPSGATLPEQSRGVFSAELPSGQRILVAGTAHHLYKFTGTAWIEFDSGQTFHLSTGRWSFAMFGTHILAVDGTDEDQVSVNGNPFKPLSTITVTGTPPKAVYVEVNDQSVFLVPPESDVVWFSSADTLWAPNVATLTGFIRLTGTPGLITAIHAIRGGIVVYKRESLYFGQFVGPPFIWDFGPSAISKNIGTRNQEAVVNAGDVHLFLGPDDFYLFDGSSLQRVQNNLREWFFRRADPVHLAEVLGVWDREHSLAMWHYSSIEAEPAGARDEWLAYNVRTQKWTKGTAAALGVDAVVDVVQPNFLITNDLTYAAFGERFQHYDNPDLNIAYNDPSLGEEVREVPGVLDSMGQLLIATGAPKSAFFQTGEFPQDGSAYYQLGRVRVIFAEWPVDRFGHLQSLKKRINGYPIPDAAPFPQPGLGPQAVLTKDGAFNLIVTARAHQLKIDFTSECEVTALALDLISVGAE